MQKKTAYLILISFLFLSIINCLLAQDSTIYLDSKKYTKENEKWYVHSTGRMYQVDINSMTVKLKENLQRSVLDNVLQNTGIKVVRENELGYIDLELSSSKSFYDWQKHLSQMGIFETVEVNSFGTVFTNDPLYANQYYLSNLQTFPQIYLRDD